METKTVIRFKSDYLRALQVSVNLAPASSAKSGISSDGDYDISVNDLVTRNVDQTLRNDIEERCRVWQKLDDEHLISTRLKGGYPARWATKGHLAIPHGFSLTEAQLPSTLSHHRIPESTKEEYLLQLRSLLRAVPTAQIIGKKLDSTKQLHLKRLKCGIDRDNLGLVGASLHSKHLISLADDLKSIERAPCSISSTSASAEHVIQKPSIGRGSSSQEKVAATEVVLSFSFYGKSGFAGAKLQRLQDFDLLGSQTLRQLRSCLHCGDKGKDDYSDRGFFFIEDTFYTDEISEEGEDCRQAASKSDSLHCGIKKWLAGQEHSRAVTESNMSDVQPDGTESPTIPSRQHVAVETDNAALHLSNCEESNVTTIPSTSTIEITSTRAMQSRTTTGVRTKENSARASSSSKRSVPLKGSTSEHDSIPSPAQVRGPSAAGASHNSDSSPQSGRDRTSASSSRKRSRPMSSRGKSPSVKSSAPSDGTERDSTCTGVGTDGHSEVRTQRGTELSAELNVQSQNTALQSLNLRVGVRYLFRHGSDDSCDCEHHFYVTDMHLLCPHDIGPSSANRLSLSRDMPLVRSYPRQTFAARTLAKKCGVCFLWGARYAVYGDRLADKNPMLLCQHCYYIMHYSPSGDLIYDDFLVLPYVNDVPDEH